MNISERGLNLIKQFEGCRLEAYRDCGYGIWTIGYGMTDNVHEGMTITQEQADQMLLERLKPYELAITDSCTSETTQEAFDAFCSLSWNIGIAGFKKSTVLRLHNSGDHAGAARAFALWNKAGGKQVAGLVRRRAAEAALYLEGTDDSMPQRVDAPKPLTSSTINKASAAGGVVATLGAVHETIDAVKQFQDDIASVKTYLMPLAFIAIVVLCGVVIYQRVTLRKDGVV